MSASIAEELLQQYPAVATRLGFRKVAESYHPEAFGNSHVDLENQDLRVRFSRDRWQILVYVATLSEPNRWWSVTEVATVLGKWAPFDERDAEGLTKLDPRLNLTTMADLFLANYPAIVDLFCPDRVKATTDAITQMRNDEMAKTLARFKKTPSS